MKKFVNINDLKQNELEKEKQNEVSGGTSSTTTTPIIPPTAGIIPPVPPLSGVIAYPDEPMEPTTNLEL